MKFTFTSESISPYTISHILHRMLQKNVSENLADNAKKFGVQASIDSNKLIGFKVLIGQEKGKKKRDKRFPSFKHEPPLRKPNLT